MWNEEAKQQIIKFMEKDTSIRMVVLSGIFLRE